MKILEQAGSWVDQAMDKQKKQGKTSSQQREFSGEQGKTKESKRKRTNKQRKLEPQSNEINQQEESSENERKKQNNKKSKKMKNHVPSEIPLSMNLYLDDHTITSDSLIQSQNQNQNQIQIPVTPSRSIALSSSYVNDSTRYSLLTPHSQFSSLFHSIQTPKSMKREKEQENSPATSNPLGLQTPRFSGSAFVLSRSWTSSSSSLSVQSPAIQSQSNFIRNQENFSISPRLERILTWNSPHGEKLISQNKN